MLAWFHALDLRLLYLINQTWSTPSLDPLMARMSDFDSWRYPLLVAGLLMLIFGGFRGRQFIILMAACLLLGDAVIDHTFKYEVHRPRPMETEWHLRVVTVRGITESNPHPVRGGNSFTSGHACNNVALAFVACAIFGRAVSFLWVTALLVSYSRIYCGSHYPSDIVGSWIVALCYSYFIVKAAEWLWQKWAPKFFPSLYAHHPRLFPRCSGWIHVSSHRATGNPLHGR
jgi:undecaprenyl-diphosphatase